MSTHAPYNFVPFAEHPIRRYQSPADLPAHGDWDPELLSGEIRLTITAKTPIFIGNGEKKQKADFFRTVEGKYAIPGSTLRGLVRENMQILGLGAIRKGEDYQDYSLLYREFASKRKSLAGRLKQDYERDVFETVKNAKGENERRTRCYPGFLCKRKDTYYILPAKRNYRRIRRDLPFVKAWLEEITIIMNAQLQERRQGGEKNVPKQFDGWAFSAKVWFQCSDDGYVSSLTSTEAEGYSEGWVLCPGPMNVGTNRSQIHLYLFEKGDEEAIPLSEEDIIAYREDYSARVNTLGRYGGIETDRMFWALPEENEEKPVFYILGLSGRNVFGMTKMLRVPYHYTISDGIPADHATVDNCFLDYTNAILGFAEDTQAYRSRVSFGDFVRTNNAGQEQLFYTQLGEPKLSFYPGYAKDGMNYNTLGFQFRGFKQYWLQPVQKKEVSESSFTTEMKPLNAGSAFSGSIHFRNLHPDELGLLLWCLVLDPDCQQNIGRGKPYGYGRVEIKVDSIVEFNPFALYGKDRLLSVPTGCQNVEGRVRELIDAYKTTLRDEFGIPVDDAQNIQELLIQDFLYMKKTVQPKSHSFSYMSLKEFQNVAEALPPVEAYRTGAELPDPAAPGGPASWRQQPKPDAGRNSPRQTESKTLTADAIVEGVVTRIVSKGFTVRLANGQEGFVPIKEVANHFVIEGTIGQYVQIGEKVSVKVLPPFKGNLSLSLKQAN